jgi:acetone monooxygenase
MSSLFPGQETFKGRLFHTARWPNEAIDLAGKRVGVVGIGATGIQVIQTIADKVGHLTVFVRTPQYIIPMKNLKFTAEDQDAYKSKFEWLAKRLPHTSSRSSASGTIGSNASRRTGCSLQMARSTPLTG